MKSTIFADMNFPYHPLPSTNLPLLLVQSTLLDSSLRMNPAKSLLIMKIDLRPIPSRFFPLFNEWNIHEIPFFFGEQLSSHPLPNPSISACCRSPKQLMAAKPATCAKSMAQHFTSNSCRWAPELQRLQSSRSVDFWMGKAWVENQGKTMGRNGKNHGVSGSDLGKQLAEIDGVKLLVMRLMKLPGWQSEIWQWYAINLKKSCHVHFALTSFPAYISCLPQSVFVTWPTFCCSSEGTFSMPTLFPLQNTEPSGFLQGIHLRTETVQSRKPNAINLPFEMPFICGEFREIIGFTKFTTWKLSQLQV